MTRMSGRRPRQTIYECQALKAQRKPAVQDGDHGRGRTIKYQFQKLEKL